MIFNKILVTLFILSQVFSAKGDVEFEEIPVKLLPNAIEIHLDTFNETIILALRDSQIINVQQLSKNGNQKISEFNYPVKGINMKWFKWLPKQNNLIYEEHNNLFAKLYKVVKRPSGLWSKPFLISSTAIEKKSERGFKWLSSPNHYSHAYFKERQPLKIYCFLNEIVAAKEVKVSTYIKQACLTNNKQLILWGLDSAGIYTAQSFKFDGEFTEVRKRFLSHAQNDRSKIRQPKYGSLDTKFQPYFNLSEQRLYVLKWGHYDGFELNQLNLFCISFNNLEIEDSLRLPLGKQSFEKSYSVGPSQIRNFNTIYPLRLSLKEVSKNGANYNIWATYERHSSVSMEGLTTNLSEAKVSYFLELWKAKNSSAMHSKVIPLNHLILNTRKLGAEPIWYQMNENSQDLRTGCIFLNENQDPTFIFNDTKLNYLATNPFSKSYEGKNGSVLTMVSSSMKEKTKTKLRDSLQVYVPIPSQELLYLNSKTVLCFALKNGAPLLLKISLKSKE